MFTLLVDQTVVYAVNFNLSPQVLQLQRLFSCVQLYGILSKFVEFLKSDEDEFKVTFPFSW